MLFWLLVIGYRKLVIGYSQPVTVTHILLLNQTQNIVNLAERVFH